MWAPIDSVKQACQDRPTLEDHPHRDRLREWIADAAHYLPSQGPITVFVHHNTLHALEHLPFDEGVQAGAQLFQCEPYLSESRYRAKFARGRIRVEDLDAVLQEDLGDEADLLVASFGTRYALRLAMLQYPLPTAQAHHLRWVVAETDALRTFREDVPEAFRSQMLTHTRKWVLTYEEDPQYQNQSTEGDVLGQMLQRAGKSSPTEWSESKWESFVLNYLWRVCRDGVRSIQGHATSNGRPVRLGRLRDRLISQGAADTDPWVHDILIRFCSAFLDQGFADWDLPDRDAGLYQSFLKQHSLPCTAPTAWLTRLRNECRRRLSCPLDPLGAIQDSLNQLGVEPADQPEYLRQTLLALRGWAGMIWQMETNAEWSPHPAPPDSLLEYVAIRLMLDQLAAEHIAARDLGLRGALETWLPKLDGLKPEPKNEDLDRRAFTVFQLAQVRGWRPRDLQLLPTEQWEVLDRELQAFGELDRRRLYHRAFERQYRNATLDAVIAHGSQDSAQPETKPALFQIACCIDEREESFRRHLEEIQPQCETLGIAGFFGVAMYYRGANDAHFTPLCPVNVKPNHYVEEAPVYSAVDIERRRADARKRLGLVSHRTHRGTRSLLGGALAGLVGSIAAFPLVARILFPRLTARLRRHVDSIVRTSDTELRLERLAEEPGDHEEHLGYSVEEMTDIVAGGLRAMGLTRAERLSRLMVICGHGSSSLNNPHEAAHDCGACGGGRGGPNARAFAQMANDPRVRQRLQGMGLIIPESTLFVGGYHNTCDDSMTWYDLDRVPMSHRELFEQAQSNIDEARQRSAHERCRRFESADLRLDSEAALRHVEGRAEDLSQTRPEYGHATNALCFVGRRQWSRGLFLDRRAFLTSYDPTQDDERSSVLEGLLRAVIPVCAGINLEYYFSYVDPVGYGCGTKLPHNITSLLGVMDGAASDLRPGLPWQMVEIHEPVRLLFVIETSRDVMLRIIDENPAIAQLVRGEWVQLAVFDPSTGHVHRFVRDQFVLYAPHDRTIPTVDSSIQWYGAQRDHLGFASIQEPNMGPGVPA